MSAKIDQKTYLQKYLNGPSGEKKKKKKKISKGKGLKIVDDDIDLTKLRPLDGDELDILGEGEDAPQIAGIIDERPEEVKKLEQFKTSSKWRVINQDDGFNSKLQIEEIKKDVVEAQKENELVFGKMYSDSEDEDQNKKNDSDQSPPRKTTDSKITKTSKTQQNNSSDSSPPRNNKKESPEKLKTESKRRENNSDSDLSPPRKHESHLGKSKEKVRKASRWGDKETRERSRSDSPRTSNKRPKYDSDASPPRKFKELGKSQRRENRNDSDASPPRKQRRNYDSDASPLRKQKKNHDSAASPSRKSNKRNKSPDSDLSPLRRRKLSPDRHDTSNRHKYRPSDKQGSSRQKSPDSDLSPPRRKPSSSRRKSPSPRRKSSRQESDSDLSPPRKTKSNDRYKRNDDSPPPTNKKMADKTLEGKKAGLSDALQLRKENDAFRRREEEAFSNMTDEVSGRNARAVARRGKRETSEERRKLEDKAKRQKELDEKYQRWSKGLKQLEEQESRVQEFLHESAKPLARLRDDRDLESALRRVERAGDPMLQYIREKKRERGELPPEKPRYKGSFPPNRFNIRPGYRWDGVDRSNGYEKKYFDQQSKRKAQEEDAYKWSTEDL